MEQNIQQEIYTCIENNQPFVFDASAGSGKTYALVETLKYIIKNQEKQLKALNRNVLVITYTNAAKDEIINRVGKHPNVSIGTIHDMMWDFIKTHQKELVEIHKEEIDYTINENKDDLGEDLEVYLSYLTHLGFPKIMDGFYDMSAKELREVLDKFNEDEIKSEHYRNIGNFKKNITKARSIKRLKEIDYSRLDKVTYDSTLSKDRLHLFKVSHDTIIKYINIIMKRYVLLMNAFESKYPYILVDEYQDSDERIYEVLELVSMNNKSVVGLFGDKMQSIYDTEIIYNQEVFKKIEKNYNRRSSNNVIRIASKISGRNEETIYNNNVDGIIKYYNASDVFSVIDKLEREWNINDNNKLQCLFLKNKDIVEHLGFINLYNIFEKSNLYKGAFWEDLNKETLPSKEEDLGEIQKILYNIMKLYLTLSKEHLFLTNINITNKSKKITQTDFEQIKKEIKKTDEMLNTIEANEITLQKFLDEIIDDGFMNNKTLEEYYYSNLNLEKDFTELTTIRSEQIIKKIKYIMSSFDKEDEESFDIEKLFNIKLEELILWYNFINKKQKNYILFDTWHNSKGLEYNNLLIVIEDRFANKDYFKDAINIIEDENQLIENTKSLNLLYVVTTRAINNLAVVYVDNQYNYFYKSLYD